MSKDKHGTVNKPAHDLNFRKEYWKGITPLQQ